MDMWQKKKAWLTMVVVEGDDILPEQGAVKRVVSEGERHFLEKTREGEFFLEEGV